MLHDNPVQISRYTQAGKNKFRRFNLISRSPRLGKETRSLPPSFGSPGTTFKLSCIYTPSSSTAIAFYTSPTKKISALVLDTIRILITVCRKNLPHGLDIANSFPPDLWGYVHRFGHKLGIISKSQLTIKVQNLNATLPTIIINCYIYITTGAGPPRRGGFTRTLQDIQERYYLQEQDVAKVRV